MATDTVRVTATAVLLGIFSLAFSLFAFATRIKVEDVRITTNRSCLYPNSAAFGLGIVAAVFLLTEQLVISTGTGCFCCAGSRCHATCGAITAVVLFVFSWLTFVIAFMGLIASAILNSGNFLAKVSPSKSTGNKNVDCYNVGGSYNSFLGAAFWSLISIVLGLMSYITFKRSASNRNIQTGGSLTNEQGIAMGQPSTEAK